METPYQETFETWNKIAQLYEDAFMELELYHDSYEAFCESITKPRASLLEIGCGPGNITRYLASRNPAFRIHAIDVAENMIALAKKNSPDAEFQVMDCRNIRDLTKQFDAIICGFTIPYLSEADCSRLLADCTQLLEEEGVFYVSFVPGDYQNSGYISGSTGDRTYFYYHEQERIKKELEKNGLLLTHLIEKVYQKSDGTREIHTILIAKKQMRHTV